MASDAPAVPISDTTKPESQDGSPSREATKDRKDSLGTDQRWHPPTGEPKAQTYPKIETYLDEKGIERQKAVYEAPSNVP